MTGHAGGTMTCDTLDAMLGDYLDGTLDDRARDGAERHLRLCARCGGLVADLNDIRSEAAALPTLRPSRDLWDGIAARIDAPVIEIGTRRSALGTRRRPIWLGAAAAALVVVSAGVSHVLTRQAMRGEQRTTQVAAAPAASAPADSTADSTAPQLTQPAPQLAAVPKPVRPTPSAERRAASPESRVPSAELPSADVQLASRAAGDAVYDREIAALRRVLRDRKSQLEPGTVAIVEQSLDVIDRAISQSRAALARDPASSFLNQQLTNALEKKLELLRTAAELPAART